MITPVDIFDLSGKSPQDALILTYWDAEVVGITNTCVFMGRRHLRYTIWLYRRRIPGVISDCRWLRFHEEIQWSSTIYFHVSVLQGSLTVVLDGDHSIAISFIIILCDRR